MIPSGTTPTLYFGLPDDIIGQWDNIELVYLTFQQAGLTRLEKTKEDLFCEVENKRVTLELSQAETLLFDRKLKIEMQFRVKFNNGRVVKSGIITTTTDRLLKEGEI